MVGEIWQQHLPKQVIMDVIFFCHWRNVERFYFVKQFCLSLFLKEFIRVL